MIKFENLKFIFAIRGPKLDRCVWGEIPKNMTHNRGLFFYEIQNLPYMAHFVRQI